MISSGECHRCGSSPCNTVDLVIFACLNPSDFLIRGLFTKFRIHKFSFSLVALL